MSYLHMIWSAPLQIILALVFLYFTMGFSIFAGFVIMVLLIPVNAVIAAKSRQLQVSSLPTYKYIHVHVHLSTDQFVTVLVCFHDNSPI